MPQFKRRHFLQFTGSALATLTLSCCDRFKPPSLPFSGLRGTQSSSRKLALLVGINAYPAESHLPALDGCLTDVELQRHLLIYRFGFNPKDILTLTDAHATRQGILEAFEEHLIQQAKPGDAVVFHYSGHGSQIADPDFDHPDGLNSTLVPVDSSRPAKADAGGIVQDITGHTLFLLMAALKTDFVTVVLDCCYSGGAKRGNLHIRAVEGGAQLQASPQERAYQQQWLSQLALTPDEFKKQRRSGVAKGVVITATTRTQLACDYPFGNFSAGAFTYVMSQYLWQLPVTQPIVNVLPNIARSTTQLSLMRQTPELEVKLGSDNKQQPVYFINELAFPAEAVITKVEGDTVELWLGGINAQSRAAFQKGAVFAIVDAQGQPQGQVQLESHRGLVGRGQLLNAAPSAAIQPGSLCLEQVRVIPSNLSLRIGLDPSLGKDTAPAKMALQTLKRIEAVPLQQREVDYIFGRMTDTYRQDAISRNPTTIPATGSLGLFSLGLDVIPSSFGAVGETVRDAVSRLAAKFKSLLATRIVKMTLNTDSSWLNVMATLRRADSGNPLIAKAFPTRSLAVKSVASRPDSAQAKSVIASGASSQESVLPLFAPVQLQIANRENRDLYVCVLVIDPSAEMTMIFPNQWTAPEDASQLGAGQTLLIPDPNRDHFTLQTQEPKGVTEVLILASVTPLQKAIAALQTIAKSRNQLQGPVALSAPIEAIENMLSDLGESNASNKLRQQLIYNNSVSSGERVHLIDTTQMATMSMTFEVI